MEISETVSILHFNTTNGSRRRVYFSTNQIQNRSQRRLYLQEFFTLKSILSKIVGTTANQDFINKFGNVGTHTFLEFIRKI